MPARSIAQQRFMGMVHAEKEGKLDKSKLDPEFAAKIERVAASIKAKAARDLPQPGMFKCNEAISSSEGPTSLLGLANACLHKAFLTCFCFKNQTPN